MFCVYRPPNADTVYLTNLCDYIITVAGNYSNAIICCTGDLNLPDMIWESESIESHKYPLAINKFVLNMPVQCGFTQMVNFPTREINILLILYYPSILYSTVYTTSWD